MAAEGKIALRGFDRLSLFPVIKNTTEEYEVGERFAVPEVQSMTKDSDTTEETIYADDRVYLHQVDWNGLNATITIAEMTLEMMGKLGFGTWDDTTKTLAWNPQGTNKEFAAAFACLRADNKYRMYKLYSFNISEVTESGITTKGSGGGINAYQLAGMFTGRKVDNRPGEIHDGDDLTWLNTIEGESA